MTDAQAVGIMAAILIAGDTGPKLPFTDDYVEWAHAILSTANRLHAAETAAPRRPIRSDTTEDDGA